MKKVTFLVLLGIIFFSCKKGKSEDKIQITEQEKVAQEEQYLIGTYTDSINQGINLLTFNIDSLSLNSSIVIPEIENPSFVITNKSKNIIVAVEEVASENGGRVCSYKYDKESDQFHKISSVATHGDHPCSVIFSPNEDAIIVGNFTGGNLVYFSINANGEIKDEPTIINHKGKSINKERQEKPHVHCVNFHPTVKVLFVADLGNDSIDMIPYEDENGFSLLETETKSFKVPAGSGPRHIVFDEIQQLVYVIFELTNEIGVFTIQNNDLSLKEVVSLTEAKTTSGSAAELKLTSNNEFIYATVRGNDNVLVGFKTNKGEKLEKIQTLSTENYPRNFILTDNEDYILVANQDSNSIQVFERDEASGLLTNTSKSISIHKPVYFKRF